MSYLIYSDVSLDIDMDFARANDIRFVPMEYMLGDETFNCTEPETNETMHNYYDKLRNKVTTRTSQITPQHYYDVFEPLIKEGKAIIYLCLSSGLSDTYSSANVARGMLLEDYPDARLELVDSYGATGGMGILAECAANNRAAGMTLEDNAQWLRDNALKIQYWFKVEDLMYLMRGGRVSAATAIAGTVLGIKPILTINNNGKLDTIDKKRGNKLAMKNLIERFESTYDSSLGTLVYISCADCMDEAELLKASLLEAHPELTIRITMLSPIIGAHTGPDMLSLIHFGNGR